MTCKYCGAEISTASYYCWCIHKNAGSAIVTIGKAKEAAS